MNNKCKLAAAALCAAASSVPLGAAAQTADDWQYRAAIYLYLPSISGTTTFPASGGGSSVGVDADAVLENLEFAFLGTFDAKKGLWGVYSDLVYMSLGNFETQSRSLTIGGQALPVDVTGGIEFDMKTWEWTLAGTYELVSTPQHKLDLLFGARLLDVTMTIDWTLAGNIGSVPLPDHAGHRSAGLSNWDGIVGVKGRAMFGDSGRWFVPYHFDVGTGESKLTWQAAAGLGYTYPWGDVVAGWRYLDYDMKSGTPIESVNFSGPAIAVGFRW